MKARGPTARAVAVIDDKTPESDLDAMQQAGFRGIRSILRPAASTIRISAARAFRRRSSA